MAKGSDIIVSAKKMGVFKEGIIGDTSKPGTVMQIQAGTAADGGGRFTWEAFNRGADGDHGLMAILLPDYLQGGLQTTAHTSGRRGQLYIPAPGEELNLLVEDVSGTGDDFTIGDLLIVDDGTGKLLATTGTPEREPFMCLENVTDPTEDHLMWVLYLGS